ncbi:hypothetical protein ABZP36_001242 [Zizania latifolia]
MRVLPLPLGAAIFSGPPSSSTSQASPHVMRLFSSCPGDLPLLVACGVGNSEKDPKTGEAEVLSFEFNLCEAVASWEQDCCHRLASTCGRPFVFLPQRDPASAAFVRPPPPSATTRLLVHWGTMGLVGTVVDAALGWMVQTILGSFFSPQMQEWTHQTGLAEDVAKLESEMKSVQILVAAAEGRRIDSSPLSDSLHVLKELLYDAEDVMDELDYYRL